MTSNVTRADLDEAAQVLDKLAGIRISNMTVDCDSVQLELDSDSAISDATVIAARMGLPVATVAPAFTEWAGSLPSGADITVTAYGDPNIAIVRERGRLSRYRFAPIALLSASAAGGAALALIAGRIARATR